jgi:hypothetical protein
MLILEECERNRLRLFKLLSRLERQTHRGTPLGTAIVKRGEICNTDETPVSYSRLFISGLHKDTFSV